MYVDQGEVEKLIDGRLLSISEGSHLAVSEHRVRVVEVRGRER